MPGHIVSDAQIKRIEEFFSSFEIRLSETSDGFTVSTTAEPLFCFSRKTVAELERLVTDTLTSYVENFWDGEGLDITVEPQTAAAPATRPAPPSIPIHAMVPYSRVRPAIRRTPGRALETA